MRKSDDQYRYGARVSATTDDYSGSAYSDYSDSGYFDYSADYSSDYYYNTYYDASYSCHYDGYSCNYGNTTYSGYAYSDGYSYHNYSPVFVPDEETDDPVTQILAILERWVMGLVEKFFCNLAGEDDC